MANVKSKKQATRKVVPLKSTHRKTAKKVAKKLEVKPTSFTAWECNIGQELHMAASILSEIDTNDGWGGCFYEDFPVFKALERYVRKVAGFKPSQDDVEHALAGVWVPGNEVLLEIVKAAEADPRFKFFRKLYEALWCLENGMAEPYSARHGVAKAVQQLLPIQHEDHAA